MFCIPPVITILLHLFIRGLQRIFKYSYHLLNRKFIICTCIQIEITAAYKKLPGYHFGGNYAGVVDIAGLFRKVSPLENITVGRRIFFRKPVAQSGKCLYVFRPGYVVFRHKPDHFAPCHFYVNTFFFQ